MGLSTDRIVNDHPSSLEILLCSICHEILWHPVTCETCEHSFCEVCLNEWFQRKKQCPNTCEYRQRTRSPYLLTQMLSSLKVACKNTVNGCHEIISYEILEKHEQTCGYEIKKCQGCLQPLLKQDIDRHELQCDHVEILCNNCQITYRRRDGHDAMQCLRNQMKNQNDLFERKLNSLENDVRRQTELLHNMAQQQKLLIERLDRQFREAEEKTKKIMRFDDVPDDSGCSGPPIQRYYGGFFWINCNFIRLSDNGKASYPNAFKPGQQCVAYTGLNSCSSYQNFHYAPHQLSMSIVEKGQTFNVESIEALASTKDNSCGASINGMRNNQTYFTKQIKLNNELQLITLNWTNIDKLTIEACNKPFVCVISQISFKLP